MANLFNKLGDLNQLRQQAMKMQQQLSGEEIVVEEGDIRVVISGDQKIFCSRDFKRRCGQYIEQSN